MLNIPYVQVINRRHFNVAFGTIIVVTAHIACAKLFLGEGGNMAKQTSRNELNWRICQNSITNISWDCVKSSQAHYYPCPPHEPTKIWKYVVLSTESRHQLVPFSNWTSAVTWLSRLVLIKLASGVFSYSPLIMLQTRALSEKDACPKINLILFILYRYFPFSEKWKMC